MKCNLSNAYTQRTVSTAARHVAEWYRVHTVLPATHTFIHEWTEPSCIHFVSIHQTALPKHGGAHLHQLTTQFIDLKR